jgi:hypothetical protein
MERRTKSVSNELEKRRPIASEGLAKFSRRRVSLLTAVGRKEDRQIIVMARFWIGIKASLWIMNML